VADELSDVSDDLSQARSAWAGPNERTAAVDAAVLRVCRALDALALHHVGRRPRRLDVLVETAQSSALEFEVTSDGRWSFQDGEWADYRGRLQSRLLRPSIRGIARAARPEFADALDVLVLDVELMCAQLIAAEGEAFITETPTPGQSVDELLEAAFAGLSKPDRDALRALAVPLDVGAGTTLMVSGEPGLEAMFLLGGTVAVDVAGGPVLLGPGSVVGERAPLTGRRRDATVRTLTDAVLLVISAAALPSLPETVRARLGDKVRL
jgi:hypothetical protein